MQEWKRVSWLLCTYGFLNAISPFSHFFYKYLTEMQGLSADDVNNFYIAPGTYFTLGFSVLFFLITDMLRYKPLIVLSSATGILQLVIFRWIPGTGPLLAASALSGIASATDIAYFSYIYSKVELKYYPVVTGHSRAARLLGRCLGAAVAQFLMMYNVVTVDKLIYISFAARISGLLLSFTLPAASASIYFYQAKSKNFMDEKNDDPSVEVANAKKTGEEMELVEFSWTNAKSLLVSHFVSGFSNKTVLLWSLWWALMANGYGMIYNYNQPLWHYIEPDRETVFNGFAEAGLTLSGALGSLLAGKLSSESVERNALWIMISCSLVLGSFSIGAGRTSTVYVSYAMYILIGAVFNFMVAVCASIVAKNIIKDSSGLIFGIDTWFATLLKTIFTVFTVSGTIFVLNPVQQYTTFGCYFYVLALVYAGYQVYRMATGKKGSV